MSPERFVEFVIMPQEWLDGMQRLDKNQHLGVLDIPWMYYRFEPITMTWLVQIYGETVEEIKEHVRQFFGKELYELEDIETRRCLC